MRRPALARTLGTSGAATLLAVLVALGVLAVPVECARAAGPHSVFISAEAVARLQNGTVAEAALPAHQAGHGHSDGHGQGHDHHAPHADHADAASVDQPEEPNPAHHAPASAPAALVAPTTGADDADASMPQHAEAALAAVAALAPARLDLTPPDLGVAALAFAEPAGPSDRSLPRPEPPPP